MKRLLFTGVAVALLGLGFDPAPVAAAVPTTNDLVVCALSFGTPAGGASGTCIAPLSLGIYDATLLPVRHPGSALGCQDGPSYWTLVLYELDGTLATSYQFSWNAAGLPLNLQPVGTSGSVLVGGFASGGNITWPISSLGLAAGLVEVTCPPTYPPGHVPSGPVVFAFAAP